MSALLKNLIQLCWMRGGGTKSKKLQDAYKLCFQDAISFLASQKSLPLPECYPLAQVTCNFDISYDKLCQMQTAPPQQSREEENVCLLQPVPLPSFPLFSSHVNHFAGPSAQGAFGPVSRAFGMPVDQNQLSQAPFSLHSLPRPSFHLQTSGFQPYTFVHNLLSTQNHYLQPSNQSTGSSNT